ncbi:hypothetical protein Sjap_023976 [Stephania japonica]|uniref:DNA annealing helicase and endonuclease ZRANB3 n=1 Tax=Stephania japonica TaxID=461633 RepID=A0AAP0ECR2_9MAGN
MEEEISEEQRLRAEANRLAALEKKRKASASASTGALNRWNLFRCRKISRSPEQPPLPIKPHRNPNDSFSPDEKFRVKLEICSPDSFAVTPEPLPSASSSYPGESQCLAKIASCLSSVVPSHYTQNHVGGKACVYKLRDYEMVQKCLKTQKAIEVQDIPWKTLTVIQKFSHSFGTGRWIPCMPEHLSDDEVDALLKKLPPILLAALLPFQLDGVRFGLQRGGSCLIADEMGLGKTIQAIAVACCFMEEGPVLVVCPAILRFSWAEEIERWLPFCSPKDIHLVFGHQDNPARLTRSPKVVVISYKMLHHLQKSMLALEWAVLIIDESHHVRCSKKMAEPEEIKAILSMAAKAKHKILLSGTPSLSRPGLLGVDKYEFAKTYCEIKFVHGPQGKMFQIRRLKEHVLVELPPKRRQILRLMLKKSDISFAISACQMVANSSSEREQAVEPVTNPCNVEDDDGLDGSSETCHDSLDSSCGPRTTRQLSNQEVGIAKLSGFREWLSIQPIISESECGIDVEMHVAKMIIFAHHLKVLDGVQEFLCEKGIGFVRIDGNTLARDRQSAVQAFRSSAEIKAAIIGITAGGVGIDFSSAQHVVFVELPHTVSELLQDTCDELHWQNLNKSLNRVSSVMNGKYDAVREIEVDRISDVERGFLEHGHKSTEGHINKELNVVDFDSNHVSSSNGITCQDRISEVTISNRFLEAEAANFGRGVTNHIVHPNTTLGEMAEMDGCTVKAEVVNVGFGDVKVVPDVPREIDANSSVLEDSLRFEVSQYTGRIHLYTCVSGRDSRPRLLFENFHVEELESSSCSSHNISKKIQQVKENPRFRNVLLRFVTEWNDLRPIEQRKLLGKPLQLPLSLELCYLKESFSHGNGGLLKGGSKRRTTPLHEISHDAPEYAVWKQISLFSGRGKEKQYMQYWSTDGEPLCKLCQTHAMACLLKSQSILKICSVI